MRQHFTIGTRGSDLALWQAGMVRSRLQAAFPSVTFEIKIIRTTGDQLQEVALSKLGDKGLFTRQIESELLNGEIDLAVHSLKDLQTEQPAGLIIGSVCEREVSNDVLISREYSAVDELPHSARVATGSLRRRSQLLHRRPDIEVVEIRGNVPTRLDKFAASELDGMILAYAGVHRLGLVDRFLCSLIPFDIMLPAVGQGAVAVEIRSDDGDAQEVSRGLDHPHTSLAVAAERAFLGRLEGGCQVPIGAAAIIESDEIILEGLVGSLDGSVQYRETLRGGIEDPTLLGRTLAERLIAVGAAELLNETRDEAGKFAGTVL